MSLIRIENDISRELSSIFSTDSNYIITDSNVIKLLPLGSKSRGRIFAIEAGEHSKNIECVQQIITHMYKGGCDRDTKVYAIGGGVVGDVAGFVAGIYMRGVSWFNIPTTLLSQVDSAVGGKTGVDYGGIKNLIGLFYKPSEIVISLHFLKSLSEEDWLSGIGEIIKTAILDAGLYEMVQSEFERIKKRDESILRAVIEKCVAIKKKITKIDLRESGVRKALNIGHTIGHALESVNEYDRSHGEYVLWGMKIENEINKGYIDSSFYLKMQTLISRALLGKDAPKADVSAVVEMCAMDKKNSEGMISLMAAENVGVIREIKYKPKQLSKELKKCLSEK